MNRIILSVTNDLVSDQRVHRVALTLMKSGAKVTLVGRILPQSLPVKRAYRIYRMKLIFKKGPFFYAEFNIRLFFFLLFARVDILVSNDLDTLPANYVASVIRIKPLVFDAHELFTEVPELIHRKLVKTLWQKMEQWILPRIKHSYTVCESIATYYGEKYGVRMKVVRNLPLNRNIINSNNRYPGLPTSRFVLYQGSVNLGRGLESLIDAFEFIDDDIKCVIVGDGDIMQMLNQRIINKHLKDRIILTGKLPFQDLQRITPFAALGLSIEENKGLNYYYTLPNKLFDYIQAEIPVLVSDFPEMRKIVDNYYVGEVIKSVEAKKLALQIMSMLQSDQQEFWKLNLSKAAKELCWENEEKELLKVFEKLLDLTQGPSPDGVGSFPIS